MGVMDILALARNFLKKDPVQEEKDVEATVGDEGVVGDVNSSVKFSSTEKEDFESGRATADGPAVVKALSSGSRSLSSSFSSAVSSSGNGAPSTKMAQEAPSSF